MGRKRGPLGLGERVGDEELSGLVKDLRAAGSTLRVIALQLDQRWPLPNGRHWHPQQISGVLDRTMPPPTQNGTEYYTPAEIVASARTVLGRIDLDPCSCEKANRTIKAVHYWTALDDGLTRDWWGRVWVNPPGRYSGIKDSQGKWWAKLVQYYQTQMVEAAIFLSFNLSILAVGQSAAIAPQAFPFVVFRRPVRYVLPDGRRKAVPYCRSMAVLVSHDLELFERFGAEFADYGLLTVPEGWRT